MLLKELISIGNLLGKFADTPFKFLTGVGIAMIIAGTGLTSFALKKNIDIATSEKMLSNAWSQIRDNQYYLATDVISSAQRYYGTGSELNIFEMSVDEVIYKSIDISKWVLKQKMEMSEERRKERFEESVRNVQRGYQNQKEALDLTVKEEALIAEKKYTEFHSILGNAFTWFGLLLVVIGFINWTFDHRQAAKTKKRQSKT